MFSFGNWDLENLVIVWDFDIRISDLADPVFRKYNRIKTRRDNTVGEAAG